METLEFKTTINAPAKHVWKTMLDEKTYREWVEVSWPNSYYVGKWGKGEKIKFVGTDMSGTMVEVTEFKPFETVDCTHIAILLTGGVEDRTSDSAKGWIGTKERYEFSERNGATDLRIVLTVPTAWADMFKEGWPGALTKLKELCKMATVGN